MDNRHQFRAKWHDYNGGIYFVTVCTYQKRHCFGEIHNAKFYPTELGKIVDAQIHEIESHYTDVEVWNYVVMPNHIHIVINVGTRFIASAESEDVEESIIAQTIADKTFSQKRGCLKPPKYGKECEDYHHNSRLASIVGAFKAGVTRTARTRRIASLPSCIWQSRFHEHIIRNQHSFDNIMNYINNNVENWAKDCFSK